VAGQLAAQAGEAAGGQVRGVDGHGLAVGQPEPVDAQHPAAGPDAEQGGQALVGGDVADLQDAGLGPQPVVAHVLGVADQLELLGDLRLGDEGALALDALEPALDDQLGQGLPDGGTGRLVLLGQGPLRGQRAAGRERLDQLHQQLFELVVLGNARGLDRMVLADLAERTALVPAPVPGPAPDLRHGISSRSPSVVPDVNCEDYGR
jgi:hypothetical protein